MHGDVALPVALACRAVRVVARSPASRSMPSTRPVGADPVRHQPHRLAGAAPGVQAALSPRRARPRRTHASVAWFHMRACALSRSYSWGAPLEHVGAPGRSSSSSWSSPPVDPSIRIVRGGARYAHRGSDHDISRSGAAGGSRRTVDLGARAAGQGPGAGGAPPPARRRPRGRGPRHRHRGACGHRQVEPARRRVRGDDARRPAGPRPPLGTGRRMGGRPPAGRAAPGAPRLERADDRRGSVSPAACSPPRRPSPPAAATRSMPPSAAWCGSWSQPLRAGPVVLAVDDMHWADAGVTAVAGGPRGLAARAPGGRVLCGPPGEHAAAPELLAEVWRRAPEPPVRPRPLGRDRGATPSCARGCRRGRAFVRGVPRRHGRQPVPAGHAAGAAGRGRRGPGCPRAQPG